MASSNGQQPFEAMCWNEPAQIRVAETGKMGMQGLVTAARKRPLPLYIADAPNPLARSNGSAC